MNRPMMCFGILLVCFGFLTMAGVVYAQAPEKEKDALAAADMWLALVDAGKYAESWPETAVYFRNAVTLEQLMQSLKAVREPLGKEISRKVKTKTYATSLPGVPDGEYEVIQFETAFENKKSAVETLRVMLDKDGKWRVSEYLIR